MCLLRSSCAFLCLIFRRQCARLKGGTGDRLQRAEEWRGAAGPPTTACVSCPSRLPRRLSARRRLSSEWLSAQSCTGDSLRQKALNTSLKVSGRPCLPAAQQSLSRGDLRGPLVLQIVRSENISAPSARQGSAGGGGGSVPRMLRLTLSDGTTSLSALELQPAAKLPAALPTGAKVRFGHSVLPVRFGGWGKRERRHSGKEKRERDEREKRTKGLN